MNRGACGCLALYLVGLGLIGLALFRTLESLERRLPAAVEARP